MSFLQRSIGEDIFTHVHFRGYKDFKKSSFISVATIEGHATLCRTYELVVWLSTTPAGQKKDISGREEQSIIIINGFIFVPSITVHKKF